MSCFEVLTATTVKTTVLWDVTPCRPVEVYWCFGGTYCLHLQLRRETEISNHLLASCWLLGLVFDHKYGGSTFLRHVCQLLVTYTASHTGRQYSSKERTIWNGEQRVELILIPAFQAFAWRTRGKPRKRKAHILSNVKTLTKQWESQKERDH
jgi:hypothetical protein